jgi:hypothetical protein
VTAVPFMGGEVGAFTPSSSGAYDTTAGFYDPAFARGCLGMNTNFDYHESASIQNLTDAWCAFLIGVAGNTYNVEQSLFRWLNGSGTEVVALNWNRATYEFKLYYLNAVGTWVNVGTNIALNLDHTLQRIDIHPVVNSATGSIKVYVAGTQRIDSGTLDLAHITAINKVRFFGMTYAGFIGIPVYVSEVVVDDESTIGRRVGTIAMTGQGATHTYASGGFAAIDEITYDDTDSINGTANGQIELFTGTPVFSGTGYRIKGLCLTARSRKSGADPAQKRFKLKAGATTSNGTTLAQDFGYLSYFHSWETNPDTAAAFLMAELPSLNYGEEAIT